MVPVDAKDRERDVQVGIFIVHDARVRKVNRLVGKYVKFDWAIAENMPTQNVHAFDNSEA